MVAGPDRAEWATSLRENTRRRLDIGRWLVGINGAAFAATLAASDLNGFGNLSPNDGRFWIAIAGICLAVSSLAKSLDASLNVGGGETIIEDMTPADIEYVHKFELLLTYDDGRSAMEQRHLLVHVLKSTDERSRPQFLVPKQLSGDYFQGQAIAELTDLNWQLRDVAALLENRRVSMRFDRAKKLIYLGILGSVAGVMLATWATNG